MHCVAGHKDYYMNTVYEAKVTGFKVCCVCFLIRYSLKQFFLYVCCFGVDGRVFVAGLIVRMSSD
jgi:hypothetical protein